MRKLCLLFFPLLIIFSFSCQKSQFSTTTRHYKHGKVTYSKHYLTRRYKLTAVARRESMPIEKASKMLPSDSMSKNERTIPEPETQLTYPPQVQIGEELIASTAVEPSMIVMNASQTKKQPGPGLSYKNPDRSAVVSSYPVNIKSKPAIRKSTPPVTRDSRKIDTKALLGFIFSILGWIPVFGIVFAVLGIIFCAASLRRFNNYPQNNKGRGLAIAGLIIGIAALVFNIIYSIYLLATLDTTMSFSMGGW